MEKPRPFQFTERKDYYGWQQNHDGLWYYTAFVENGRILDTESVALKTAFLEVAKTGNANFRFTCNQNVIISDIKNEHKAPIQEILERFGIVKHTEGASELRKNSMACVALNTCPLALAEGQRYLPSLITKIEGLMDKYLLGQEDIIVRMTGCPNGCARPYVAEIGFVGTAMGQYNLHLGGDHTGQRLNKIFRENLDEEAILGTLNVLLSSYSQEKMPGEKFGDFSLRKKWVA